MSDETTFIDASTSTLPGFLQPIENALDQAAADFSMPTATLPEWVAQLENSIGNGIASIGTTGVLWVAGIVAVLAIVVSLVAASKPSATEKGNYLTREELHYRKGRKIQERMRHLYQDKTPEKKKVKLQRKYPELAF